MNKITNALAEAAEKAFTALFDEHKENFYYCSFIISENSTPYICAWSYEALDRFVNALGITDKTQLEEEREIYKWSYADSPYNLLQHRPARLLQEPKHAAVAAAGDFPAVWGVACEGPQRAVEGLVLEHSFHELARCRLAFLGVLTRLGGGEVEAERFDL